MKKVALFHPNKWFPLKPIYHTCLQKRNHPLFFIHFWGVTFWKQRTKVGVSLTIYHCTFIKEKTTAVSPPLSLKVMSLHYKHFDLPLLKTPHEIFVMCFAKIKASMVWIVKGRFIFTLQSSPTSHSEEEEEVREGRGSSGGTTTHSLS